MILLNLYWGARKRLYLTTLEYTHKPDRVDITTPAFALYLNPRTRGQ